MQYQIDSTNPALIIFLLDQSGSMANPFGNNPIPKAEALSNAINKTIMEIGLRCSPRGGNIKNYFELALIGYGQNYNHSQSAWQGNLTGRWVVPISEVFDNPLGIRDGQPYWITPISKDATPMTNAFNNAFKLAKDWINCRNHPECFPPIIINVSDGAPTDSGNNNKDLLKEIEQFKSLRTNIGTPLILNIHISSKPGDEILFPNFIDNAKVTEFAKLLFDISSELTTDMINTANSKGYNVSVGAKGYIFNGNAKQLYDFLEIGSRG